MSRTQMYAKLYSTILDSSIWSASDSTRIVWITMLAMATKNGIVHASVDGLARRANVTLDECRAALKVLSEPDQHDKSGVTDGRRIIPMQGCWELVNFGFYREAKSIDAVRKQQWRSKKTDVLDKGPSSSSSSSSAPDPIGSTATPPKAKRSKRQLPDDFAPNPGHIELATKNRIVLTTELENFRDHHKARGSTMLDWDAALRTWIRNAAKFARSGPRPASPGEFVSKLVAKPKRIGIDW